MSVKRLCPVGFLVCLLCLVAGLRSQAGSPPPQPRPLMIAASNAPAADRAQARYLCNGKNDAAQLAAVITASQTLGGRVELSQGTFTLSSAISKTLTKDLTLSGVPGATVLDFSAVTDWEAFKLQGTPCTTESGTPSQDVRITADATANTSVLSAPESFTKTLSPGDAIYLSTQPFRNKLGGLGVVGLTGASWTASTKTLTKTGAFASYTWVATDCIYIASVSAVGNGIYTVASKTDSNTIVLGELVAGSGIGGTPTDVTSPNDGGYAAYLAGHYTALWAGGLYDGSSRYDLSVQGEHNTVDSVSGSTVYLRSPLRDNYTGKYTTIWREVCPRIVVENLELKFNNTLTQAPFQAGLTIAWSRGGAVRNCHVHGAHYAGISVFRTMDFVVEGNRVEDLWNSTNSGHYGIYVYSSESPMVRGNWVRGAKHSLSFSGTQPTRNAFCLANYLDNDRQATAPAFDSHPQTEGLTVSDCFVRNGIWCDGRNIQVSNCHVETITGSSGIHFGAIRGSDYYRASGCTLKMTGTSSTGKAGIRFSAEKQSDLTIPELYVSNTRIDGYQYAVYVSQSLQQTGNVLDTLMITNCTGTATTAWLRGDRASGGQWVGLNNVQIVGGHLKFAGPLAIIYTTGNLPNVWISGGAILEETTVGGYFWDTTGQNIGDLTIIGCHLKGPAGKCNRLYYANTGYNLRVLGCLFENFSYEGGLHSVSGTYHSVQGLTSRNCTGSPSLNGTPITW